MARKSRRTNKLTDLNNDNISKYKTAVYCRLSLVGDKINSIQNQMDYVKAYITAHKELQYISCYSDEGETGTNYNRLEFLKMMAAIHDGKINCIVVKDLSRLGRNFLETGELLDVVFPSCGVRLIAIDDEYDSNEVITGNMALQVGLQTLQTNIIPKIFLQKLQQQ